MGSRWNFGLSVMAGIVLAVLISACNARVEGCLDPEADNFDVTVDRNNQSECIYPDMLLGVSYVYGDTSFSRSRLFENDLGQVFGVPSLYILFSQFQLKGDEIGRKMVTNETDWFIEPDNVNWRLRITPGRLNSMLNTNMPIVIGVIAMTTCLNPNWR